MNLETKRLRGRQRNRWQDEVREDGRLVGGKGWKVNGKAIPLQSWTGPEGSKRLRLPDFRTIGT